MYYVIHHDADGIEFKGTKKECVDYCIDQFKKDEDYVDNMEEFDEAITMLQDGEEEALWFSIVSEEELEDIGR
jgi:hypothetical protein